MDCVIVDIDGTLTDPAHRRHHVAGKEKNWAAFNEAMGEDGPVDAIITLVRLLAITHKVVLCTGREEVFHGVTASWLLHHNVPFDALYMRPAKDYRTDDIIKSELLDRILADGYKPLLVLDDRNSVVRMWRSRGLICLQVCEGDF